MAKLSDAIARIAILEVENEQRDAKIEELQTIVLGLAARVPAPPQPAKPTPPPQWAPQGPHGMDYSGPPSGTATGGGVSWLRKDADGLLIIPGMPSGMRYDSDGRPVPPGPVVEDRAIGPDHTRRHMLDGQIIDKMVQSFDTKE